MSTLAVVDDPIFALHEAESAHPERPERLSAARAGVARAAAGFARVDVSARPASPEELGRVHEGAYLEALAKRAGGRGYLDPDTYFGPQSVVAALTAAGASVELVSCLLENRAQAGVALLRPPGHHARPGGAMGFCLLNNVAVAAAHARASGVGKVAIVDFDVHHGNGTQDVFYADPAVLFVSLHQSPFYPGTGASSETGAGDGRGYTVNVPLQGGADDAVYQAAFERVVLPILDEYAPELVLVSAGFDAHRSDPLASMLLTEQAYGWMTRRLVATVADRAKVALFLEGGYDLGALSASLAESLTGLTDGLPADPCSPSALSPRHEEDLQHALRAHRAEHWRL